MAELSFPSRGCCDEMLRDMLVRLCMHLEDLGAEPAALRWRVAARSLADAARVIADRTGRPLASSPSALLATAQQIDLWVRRLGPAAAAAKALQSAPLYLYAGSDSAAASVRRRCA